MSDANTARSERKARLRAAHKAWLEQVSALTGKSLTVLARECGMDQSALTRFHNDETRGSALDSLTIQTITDITGYSFPLEAPARAPGMSEPEAQPWISEATSGFDAAIRALTGEAAHLIPWEIRTRALESEGIRPGDIVILDLNAEAKPGDIVCAQIYDWQSPGNTRTIWRVYQPPFLMENGPDRAIARPELVDGQRVIIKGRVRDMLRPARA